MNPDTDLHLASPWLVSFSLDKLRRIMVSVVAVRNDTTRVQSWSYVAKEQKWTPHQSLRNWKRNETVLTTPLQLFRAAKADAAGEHQVNPTGDGTCQRQRGERLDWL
jgi:hypothetical protein